MHHALSGACVWIAMAVLVIATGCRKTEEATPEEAPAGAASLDRRAAQSLDVQTEFAEAAKEAFVETTQRNLDEFERKLQDVKARAESQGRLGAFAADEARFDKQKSAAEQELAEVKSAGSETWERAKASAQAACDRLEQTYREIEDEYGS